MSHPPANRQSVTVEGWSCWPLMVDTGSFTGQVIRMMHESLEELNDHRVYFCGDRRHAKCVRQSGCDAIAPRSTYDQNRLLGRTAKHQCWREISGRDRQRIASILKRQLKRCRRIRITVQEGGAQ